MAYRALSNDTLFDRFCSLVLEDSHYLKPPLNLLKDTVKGKIYFSINNLYKEEVEELHCNSDID
eukprot:15361093-Ditylum_brightwellii.AAC.1